MEKLAIVKIREKCGYNMPILLHNGKEEFTIVFLEGGGFFQEWGKELIFNTYIDEMKVFNNSLHFTIVDWFEEESTKTLNKDCTCEKYSLFQIGRRCGSIIPYVSLY